MKILIAVIAYNEQDNIITTLKSLVNCGYDIVVIDDGSVDNTHQLVRQLGIDVIRHCVNTNNAMITVSSYLSYAHRKGYDVVCQFDGDGQHLLEELPKIIAPIQANIADYVIGSRFITKNGFQSYFFRRIGINLFSSLVTKIVGERITDITSGFRAYSPMVMEYFDVKYNSELHDTSQLLLLSYYAGARIQEVSVEMKVRAYGESEFNFPRSILYPLTGIICIIGVLIQKRKKVNGF